MSEQEQEKKLSIEDWEIPASAWKSRQEHLERLREFMHARERARLSVLNLTEKDKRFLRSLKIAI